MGRTIPKRELANAKDMRRNEIVMGGEEKVMSLELIEGQRWALVWWRWPELVTEGFRTWRQVWISFQVGCGAVDSSDST